MSNKWRVAHFFNLVRLKMPCENPRTYRNQFCDNLTIFSYAINALVRAILNMSVLDAGYASSAKAVFSVVVS